MKNVLNDVIQQQTALRDDVDSNENATISLITFGNKNSHFYTELKNIKIVITNDYVIPYPTPVDGHIGLIAERGQIIPLINSPIKEKNPGHQARIIIFEDVETEQLFGIEVDYVKKEDVKIEFYEELEHSDQKILTIGGNAYYLYDPYTYFRKTA
jgi:chemotaxis signal transduction protein